MGELTQTPEQRPFERQIEKATDSARELVSNYPKADTLGGNAACDAIALGLSPTAVDDLLRVVQDIKNRQERLK